MLGEILRPHVRFFSASSALLFCNITHRRVTLGIDGAVLTQSRRPGSLFESWRPLLATPGFLSAPSALYCRGCDMLDAST